jgi:uncharacterized protein (DUF2147 family)
MVAAIVLPCLTVRAQNTTSQQAFVGIWDTGEGGRLETYIQGGKLYGKALHTQNKLDNNGVCKKCDGDLKNKPFVGMVVVYDFTTDASGVWSNGHLLDPSTGMVAQGIIKTQDNGATLSVRGYLGSPMLGQTVIWKRIK